MKYCPKDTIKHSFIGGDKFCPEHGCELLPLPTCKCGEPFNPFMKAFCEKCGMKRGELDHDCKKSPEDSCSLCDNEK